MKFLITIRQIFIQEIHINNKKNAGINVCPVPYASMLLLFTVKNESHKVGIQFYEVPQVVHYKLVTSGSSLYTIASINIADFLAYSVLILDSFNLHTQF